MFRDSISVHNWLLQHTLYGLYSPRSNIPKVLNELHSWHILQPAFSPSLLPSCLFMMLCPSLDCAFLIPLASRYHRPDHAIHVSMWGCCSQTHPLPCPENVALLLHSYPGPAAPSSCQHQLRNVTEGSLSSHPGYDMPPYQPSSPHCGTPGLLKVPIRSRQMGSCKHLDEDKFGKKALRQAASSPLRSVPNHNHEKRVTFHHSVLHPSFTIPTPRRCMFRKSEAADGWHCSVRTHPCLLPDPTSKVETSLM